MNFKGMRYSAEVIILCVTFYLKYGLSLRNLEEIFTIRNLFIDHSTINRWVIKFSELIEKNYRKKKRKFCNKYYIDETYVKVNGNWMYLYRAIDRKNETIDFYFSSNRSKKAAKRFFQRIFKNNGTPEEITLDKNPANIAAIEEINKKLEKNGQNPIKIRQNKYLNNRIEQDHRNIKRKMNQIQTFKSYYSAKFTLAGVEIMHSITKNLKNAGDYCVKNLITEVQGLVAQI
jgi:putative transposase